MNAPDAAAAAPTGWADLFGWQGRLGRRRFLLHTLGGAFAVGATWLGALLLMLMVYGYSYHAGNQPLDLVVALVASLAGATAVATVAIAFALAAAFLNAAFDFCLGCEMYLLGKRLAHR